VIITTEIGVNINLILSGAKGSRKKRKKEKSS
jgi:hypothetical protein